MIGLLDPALLLQRAAEQVEHDLDNIIIACRRHHIRLVALREYWPRLWMSLGRNLEQALNPQARRALQTIRQMAETTVPHLQPTPTKVWRLGFRQLFDTQWLGANWEDTMALAVVAAVSTNEEVIMFTRRILGRNVVERTANHCTLHENTRWILHVSARGIGPRQISCMYHRRNFDERWTSRYDWRLPAANDGARYPFWPRDKWWKSSCEVIRTMNGKPTWVDAQGNGWARPNIPGGAGYHWDVFIRSPGQQQSIGARQINVVQFGAPPREGTCGSLHHVASNQAGQISDTGWNC